MEDLKSWSTLDQTPHRQALVERLTSGILVTLQEDMMSLVETMKSRDDDSEQNAAKLRRQLENDRQQYAKESQQLSINQEKLAEDSGKVNLATKSLAEGKTALDEERRAFKEAERDLIRREAQVQLQKRLLDEATQKAEERETVAQQQISKTLLDQAEAQRLRAELEKEAQRLRDERAEFSEEQRKGREGLVSEQATHRAEITALKISLNRKLDNVSQREREVKQREQAVHEEADRLLKENSAINDRVSVMNSRLDDRSRQLKESVDGQCARLEKLVGELKSAFGELESAKPDVAANRQLVEEMRELQTQHSIAHAGASEAAEKADKLLEDTNAQLVATKGHTEFVVGARTKLQNLMQEVKQVESSSAEILTRLQSSQSTAQEQVSGARELLDELSKELQKDGTLDKVATAVSTMTDELVKLQLVPRAPGQSGSASTSLRTQQQEETQAGISKRALTDPRGPGETERPQRKPSSRTSAQAGRCAGSGSNLSSQGQPRRRPSSLSQPRIGQVSQETVAELTRQLDEVSQGLMDHMRLPAGWDFDNDTRAMLRWFIRGQNGATDKRPVTVLDLCASKAADGEGTCPYQRSLKRAYHFPSVDLTQFCPGCRGKTDMGGLCIHVSWAEGQQGTEYNPDEDALRWVIEKRRKRPDWHA